MIEYIKLLKNQKKLFEEYIPKKFNFNSQMLLLGPINELTSDNIPYFIKTKKNIVDLSGMTFSEIPIPQNNLYQIPNQYLIGSIEAVKDKYFEYIVRGNIERFFEKNWNKYFLMGFWGYGLNNHAFYYLRSDSKRKIYFKLPYGGVSGDINKQKKRINKFLVRFFEIDKELNDDLEYLKISQSMFDTFFKLKLKDKKELKSNNAFYYSEDNFEVFNEDITVYKKFGYVENFHSRLVNPNIKNLNNLLKYSKHFDKLKNLNDINLISIIQSKNFNAILKEFKLSLYRENMINSSFHMKWEKEAQNYFEDPQLIKNAPLKEVQNLFTLMVSKLNDPKFFKEMAQNGLFKKLFDRLEVIKKELIDKCYGAIIGLAVGDALGASIEFKPPGTFEPVVDMIGGGPHNLNPGEWTDDTTMALCLAESLIKTGKFDPIDQLKRYNKWYKEGYLSVNGICFDIGNTILKALNKFERTQESYPGPFHERSAGNGSLMRLAPIPIFYLSNPLKTVQYSGKSSRTTHNHPLTVDACRYFGGLIHGAIIGTSKEELVSEKYSPIPSYWTVNEMEHEMEIVAEGSFKNLEPPEIRGRGFVVKSLEAALWAFYKTDNFEDGCLKAVNLGDDADTTGAIYGQLAGAYYGASGIPKKWINKLVKLELIENYVEELIKT